MSSLTITIDTKETEATIRSQLVKQSASSAQECIVLGNYLYALGAGVKTGSFEVNTGSVAPVKGSGTITITFASLIAADTLTIGGTVLTCVTAAPANQGEFQKLTDAIVTATNLAAVINAHTTISQFARASSIAGVVTVTSKAPGIIGNFISLATSNAAGAAVSGALLTGGAGGVTGTAVSYSRGN